MPDSSGQQGEDAFLSAFRLDDAINKTKSKIIKKTIPRFPEGDERRPLFLRLFEPWPDWTLDIIGKYVGTYFPTLKPKEITAGIRGFFRGEFHELDNITQSKLIGHVAGLLKYLEIKPVFSDFSAEEIEVILLNPMKEQVSQHLEFILSLPKTESEVCLKAFSKAYSNTFTEIGEPKGLKTNRPILWALVFRWPIIEKMPNVAALHKYLQTILPLPLVGDIKRLEAICRKHHIKFCKRGRPKKS
jgi:hypothetical protein